MRLALSTFLLAAASTAGGLGGFGGPAKDAMLSLRPCLAFVPRRTGTAGRRAAFRTPLLSTARVMSASTKDGETETADAEGGGTKTSSKKASAIEWTTDRVRSTFVDYFTSPPRSHSSVPSSPSVPLTDPTLLFANAGMNQFKPIFLGRVDPSSPLASLSRAANSQKCIRAGGKHNDLDDVGRDTYHHTFFEMLGSWSFGDYFKAEAIDWAWELLTDVYGIDGGRLYATYFRGDEALGLEPDLEARELWLRYLPEERVIGCDAKDNFWEMGETGPCGPCSEIHYDRIGDRDASSLVNADVPDVIEIWNIVFVQYNRDEGSKLSPLPLKHIDTGMGLERLASVLQDKSSNYDIDVFTPIFDEIEKLSSEGTKGGEGGVGPYGGLVLEDDATLRDTAYRAVSDHVRALTFAIADGAVPNNEGRGYVLRRILRRGARYGQQILGMESGFMARLVPVVVDTFGDVYPELRERREDIVRIVREEEDAFASMLDRGIKYFSELTTELSSTSEDEGGKTTEVPGEKAFYLYDTLGFPIDLTQQMAEESGLTVDVDGFDTAMEEQKRRSRDARRAAKAGEGGEGQPVLELVAEQTAWLADNGVEATDDGEKYLLSQDAGSGTEAKVMAVFGPDGFLSEDEVAAEGDYVGLVLDKTSFYAEAGGQESDIGTIEISDGEGEVTAKFEVTDVQSYGAYILHTGAVASGSFRVNAHATCRVDYDRRKSIAPNHSMTHVLNAALRTVLGDGVEQRGSYCNDEKLRFDFSHRKALTLKELTSVEEICRRVVTDAEEVTATVMPLDEAKAIEGVRAVFGEVYPDPVRVVSVGSETSVEFCGGTHVTNTDEAEAFAIVEETAVAKGIRRITAVTRGAAREAIEEGAKLEAAVAAAETLDPDESAPDLSSDAASSLRKSLDSSFLSAPLKSSLRSRVEAIQKKAVDAKKRALAKKVDGVLQVVKKEIEEAAERGERVLVLNVDIGADGKASQKVLNAAKKVAPDMAFMGLSEEDPDSGGKLACFAVVPPPLTSAEEGGGEGLRADEWVRAALAVCGGRGGGKADSAQGQAKECGDVEAVVEGAASFAAAKVGGGGGEGASA